MWAICTKNGFVVYADHEAYRVATPEDAPSSAFYEDADEAVKEMIVLIDRKEFRNEELTLQHVDDLVL